MGCIYLVTNKINGKQYVGKTAHDLCSRKHSHEKSAESNSLLAFHCALRKYGFNSFGWKVLFDSVNDEDLSPVEIRMICILKTKAPNGYNLTDGGEGTTGWKAPKDWIKNRPNFNYKGRKHTSEANEKNRKAHLGKRHTESAKLKMSLVHRGVPKSREHIEKMRLASIGNKYGIGNRGHCGKNPGHSETMRLLWKTKEYRERWMASRTRHLLQHTA